MMSSYMANAEISETPDGWEWSVEADGEEWASGIAPTQYEAAREAAHKVQVHFAWNAPLPGAGGDRAA